MWDHTLISIQLDGNQSRHKYPSNFNHIWLQYDHLCSLVQYNWNSLGDMDETDVMKKIAGKLKALKHKVVVWEKEKKATCYLGFG